MNAKTWAPLAVAIVLGTCAALIARKSLMNSRPSGPVVKTVQVVVASAAVAPGHELTAEDVKLSPIPGQTLPEGMSSQTGELVGRVTLAPLVPGQPVLQGLLAPKGTSAGLQALIPSGMRAITIDVNESSSVAGLLMPGSRVDVVTTAITQDNPGKSNSRLIAQDLLVLAVGQRLSGAKPDGEKDSAVSHTVTLLVTPHDAEALDLASAATRCRLVLRGSGDNAQSDEDPVTFVDLLGGGGASLLPVAPVQPVVAPTQNPTTQPTTMPAVPQTFDPPRRVVTVILGSEEKRVTFRDEHSADAPVRDPFSSTQHEQEPQ